MKMFLITSGAFLLGFVVAESQAAFSGGQTRVPVFNNLCWAIAFALIAAGLCL